MLDCRKDVEVGEGNNDEKEYDSLYGRGGCKPGNGAMKSPHGRFNGMYGLISGYALFIAVRMSEKASKRNQPIMLEYDNSMSPTDAATVSRVGGH